MGILAKVSAANKIKAFYSIGNLFEKSLIKNFWIVRKHIESGVKPLREVV
jgi:hypothetical protein